VAIDGKGENALFSLSDRHFLLEVWLGHVIYITGDRLVRLI